MAFADRAAGGLHHLGDVAGDQAAALAKAGNSAGQGEGEPQGATGVAGRGAEQRE
ncbi:MAG TPA: hypothetical protein VIM19_17680 [Actinomycetes bacterium]